MNVERTNTRGLLRILPLLIGLLLIGAGLREADLGGAAARVTALGPLAALVLLPHLLMLTFDSLAFRHILAAVGARVSLLRVVPIRMSSEALLVSLPAGALVAETVKPWLLSVHAGVPVPRSLGALAGRRVAIVGAHGAVLAIAAVLGWPFLLATSREVTGGALLPWIAVASAVALAAGAFVLSSLLRHGALAARLLGVLRRVRSRRLAAFLDRTEAGFAHTDESAKTFLDRPAAVASALALHLCAWLTEAFESWLILQLLGVPVSPAEALAIEALLAVLRSAVFFLPAGLGAQDLGWVAFLAAAGVPDAATAAAAFLALKRGKELAWVVVGWLVLTFHLSPPRSAEATA